MNRIRTPLLIVLLGALSVGWRSGGNGLLQYPQNMSLQDSILLVSDRYSGVHVFDVSDPADPQRRYVIPMLENRGNAMKGDILYTNDWQALYAIRLEADTFTVVRKIVSFGYNEQPYEGMYRDEGGFGCACPSDGYDAVPLSSGSTGSSYATFAVIGDYLYFFSYGELVTMDISTPEDPVELSRTRLEWSVQTIYPTQRYLFLGGSRGMYIYSRESPANPVKVGQLVHARSCDPVVVSGRYAYVTLRGGNTCGQTNDLFLVVYVADPANPQLRSQTPLPTPYGLAVDFPLAYISNGNGGTSLIDVREAAAPVKLQSWSGIRSKDFILRDDILYVMGFDDVRLYDVSDPLDPVQLSGIQ